MSPTLVKCSSNKQTTIVDREYQEDIILTKLKEEMPDNGPLLKERVKSKLIELIGQISHCNEHNLLIAVV